MASPLPALVASLRSQGVITEAGARHVKLFYNGRLVGVLPRDLRMDDKRALQGTRSQLRRAGLQA